MYVGAISMLFPCTASPPGQRPVTLWAGIVREPRAPREEENVDCERAIARHGNGTAGWHGGRLEERRGRKALTVHARCGD